MTFPAATTEVRTRHTIDQDKLRAWLSEVMGGLKPMTLRQFRGGQSNPTYWVRWGEQAYVLRKKPPGKLLPSAHAVEREFRVMRALANTRVPVAKAHALCEDASVIGTPFFLMDYVEGRVFWDVRLPEQSPEERHAIYKELARVMVTIHQVDVNEVGLSDYGRQGGYVERQVRRWSKQYRAAETQSIESMDHLIEWLPKNIPSSDETTLSHGDFRLDNVIFHPSEPKALAVIDWELSTLGHPLADLAYTCMLYDVMLPNVGGLLGVDFETTGIPSEETFVAEYQRQRNHTIEDWPTFKAFSLFRLASIAQGVYKRSLDGNASSDSAAQYGAAVKVLADVACKLIG